MWFFIVNKFDIGTDLSTSTFYVLPREKTPPNKKLSQNETHTKDRDIKM